ncbi:hypothetical protein M0638_07680 [Roseomonas sp. NAR14]|uniref:Uncharacterized protein n=1 Tax=Roseomonas acroporae TaxID=2937791 RepID=A0A9X2BUM2_9PROT|nr:hypothetical protein [Roseomonas acroporae]MCK8784256.1 hypothetical protein [Roseomonas acroporae]
MSHLCAVPGCARPVGGGRRASRAWSIYCNKHRSHERRHGHAEQRQVNLKELAPYLKITDRRLKVTPEARAWDAADERFRALADAAATDLAAWNRGQPMSGIQRLCAEEIDKLARVAKPREVWRLVAAVILMERREPGRFKSDDAFFVQMARVVRRLRDVNAYEWWDHKARRTRRGYRDPNKRVMVEMGRVLSVSLGMVGTTLARMEDAEEARQDKVKAELVGALGELEAGVKEAA